MFLDDLVNLALACHNDKWYDTAINFLRVARDMYKATKDTEEHEESTVKLLNRMSKDLVKIQNTMLETKRERVGPGSFIKLGPCGSGYGKVLVTML